MWPGFRSRCVSCFNLQFLFLCPWGVLGGYNCPVKDHEHFCMQALNAIAQRQAEEFPPIPGAAKFCCNHLEGADPHYRSKCIEYAPQHMLTCDTQPNAFKIACTGTS